MRAHCVTQRLGSVPGVTSMGRKAKREGVCASAELTHFAVQWKLTQHCKTTLLQEKLKNQEQVMQRGRQFCVKSGGSREGDSSGNGGSRNGGQENSSTGGGFSGWLASQQSTRKLLLWYGFGRGFYDPKNFLHLIPKLLNIHPVSFQYITFLLNSAKACFC